MDKFIVKDQGSNFYLRTDDGMGGFLNPPTHPQHTTSIIEKRGGHEVGYYSLTGARDEKYLPGRVRGTANGILKRWVREKGQEQPDEVWLASVYNYFRNCYSPDGENRNVSDCLINNANSLPPERHLAYLFVKEFYPAHKPDIERILHSDVRGEWHRQRNK